MGEPSFVDVGTRETLCFVAAHLPSRSARFLEIGCGSGRLAGELARRGVRVRGLEPDPKAAEQARARGVDVVCASLLDHEDAPFDLALFSRSLHHIHPLGPAIARSFRLLKPGGLLLVEDFAVERIDRATAAWRYEMEEAPDANADPLVRWGLEHREDPPISDSAAMRAAIANVFVVEAEASVPYLYRYLLPADEGDARSAVVGEQLFDTEKRLIAAGVLRAIGLRLVARRA